MARLSWFKFYPRDYLNGTRGLTLEERGFYSDILALLYERGGDLLDDEMHLSCELRLPVRVFRRLKTRLIELGKLYVTAGRLHNGRADREVPEHIDRLNQRRGARLSAAGNSEAVSKSDNTLTGSNDPSNDPSNDAQNLDSESERKDSESLGGHESVTRAPELAGAQPTTTTSSATPIELRFVERCEIAGANPATVRDSIAAWRSALPPGKVLTILDAAADKNNPYRYAGRAVGNAITEFEAACFAATQPEPDPWLEAIRRSRQRDEEHHNADFTPASGSLLN